MQPIVLLSCAVAAGILILFLGLGLLIGRSPATLANRIDEYAAVISAQTEEKKKTTSNGQVTGLAPGVATYIRTELARADLRLTISEYVLLTIITTAVGLVLAYVIFHQTLLLTFGGAVAGFYAPRAYVRYSQGKRLAAFNGQLENTLVLLANALRSGYGLLQAIETVGKQVASPMSDELGRVVREFALGVPIEAALGNMLRRNPSIDLDLVITAINVNHEAGGKLSEVLDSIAFTIRDRVRLAGEIRAITAMQRASALVLMFLPAILGLVLFALSPDYISVLWQQTCGLTLIGVAVILMFIGYWVVRRIIAIQY
jgi:tight adherence protein B